MPTPLFNDWPIRHLAVLCVTYVASVVVVVRVPQLRDAGMVPGHTADGTSVGVAPVAPGAPDADRKDCLAPTPVTVVNIRGHVYGTRAPELRACADRGEGWQQRQDPSRRQEH